MRGELEAKVLHRGPQAQMKTGCLTGHPVDPRVGLVRSRSQASRRGENPSSSHRMSTAPTREFHSSVRANG